MLCCFRWRGHDVYGMGQDVYDVGRGGEKTFIASTWGHDVYCVLHDVFVVGRVTWS